MKYLGIYIKDRKVYFFLTAFICGVTAVINYLYSAPPQAGIYAFKISLTVLVIVCAADYVHFYKKHENLQRHCHLKEVHALEDLSSDFRFETTAVETVVKKAVKRFAGQFIHRQITLAMENLHSEIETDEKWLLFILEQLLSNAVKYTQKGGTVKIYEKETLLKSDTVLVIEDNGIGIQSEDLPRIMERGYTGYNGRGASKSSGIGLYLCKKAADQLGIDIEVESEPYHGTKVLLTIRQHHTRHE